MTATIISGRETAQTIITSDLIPRTEALKAQGITPKLVVILIGDHAASASYVRQKEKYATQVGIASEVRRFDATITQDQLLAELGNINDDESIHGVIVQLPVPDHIDVPSVLEAIHPTKDVDGFHAENIGKLVQKEPCLQCCTPKGIMSMLHHADVELSGAHAVVVGRSNIVGKPIASLLLNANATVTVCHSRTKDLASHTKQADVLVVAVGRPEMVTAEHIKPGAVVIDVGIHRKPEGGLCGDVHYESAHTVAGAISLVPGGVGPMTVVSLIQNTIEAAEATRS